MKKILLLFLFFSYSLFTLSAQSWLWARQGKNHTTQNEGDAIAIDNLHNACFTGTFSNDTLVLATDTLLIKGPSRQAFLQKYDENGNLLWARTSESKTKSGDGTSPLGTNSVGLATDFYNNIYITGNFWDTEYFQSSVLENQYNALVYVTKYDANGNVKWAQQCTRARGRGNVNCGQGLVCDKSGNVYVTGYFGDTVSFGSYTLKTQNIGTFLVKYDSNGNVIWAKQSNSSNYYNLSHFITIDKLGYIYISGCFQNTIIFGTQTLTSPSLYDSYIVKYDSNGNVIWARQSTHTGSRSYAEGYGICTDKENNIYTTGFINDSVKFGATTLISARNQYYSIYWAKYDSRGNALWAKQSYDLDLMEWDGWSINVDTSENLYLTGFRNTVLYSNAKVVFDMDTLKQNDAGNLFLFIKMDSSGTVLNGYLFQSIPGYGVVQPLAVDSSGCFVYYGGTVDTSVVFGNDTVGTSVNPKPNEVNYPFIARWSDGECLITTGNKTRESPNFRINLYPNPNSGIFTLVCRSERSEESLLLEIYNVLGEKVLTEPLPSAQGDNRIDIINKPNGIYLYRVTNLQGNLISSGKFIIR